MECPRRGPVALIVALATVVLVRPAAPTEAALTGQIDPNIVVHLTSLQPGDRLRGRVEIDGYALDRRSLGGSGLNELDLQVFVDDSSDNNKLLGFAAGGLNSPEAVAAYGPQFDQAGFRAVWETCTFPAGPHRVFVWVASEVSPGSRNFNFIDVEIEPCSPGEIIWQDDFSARPGGIETMRPPVEQVHGLASVFADFAAGISARCTQPDRDCRYGLQFREREGPGSASTNGYYLFAVNPMDGTFAADYHPVLGGDPSMLAADTQWRASSAIRRGTTSNRLAVIAQGGRVQLFVNGERVLEWRADGLPQGWLSWAAGTRLPGGVEVEFANLVVAVPGPPEVLGPVLSSLP